MAVLVQARVPGPPHRRRPDVRTRVVPHLRRVIFYFALLFFFGVRTFQRGYLLLGVLGIFLPLLWLVGGLLPDRHLQRTTGL